MLSRHAPSCRHQLNLECPNTPGSCYQTTLLGTVVWPSFHAPLHLGKPALRQLSYTRNVASVIAKMELASSGRRQTVAEEHGIDYSSGRSCAFGPAESAKSIRFVSLLSIKMAIA